jgi:ribosomal protein S27AE
VKNRTYISVSWTFIGLGHCPKGLAALLQFSYYIVVICYLTTLVVNKQTSPTCPKCAVFMDLVKNNTWFKCQICGYMYEVIKRILKK